MKKAISFINHVSDEKYRWHAPIDSSVRALFKNYMIQVDFISIRSRIGDNWPDQTFSEFEDQPQFLRTAGIVFWYGKGIVAKARRVRLLLLHCEHLRGFLLVRQGIVLTTTTGPYRKERVVLCFVSPNNGNGSKIFRNRILESGVKMFVLIENIYCLGSIITTI